VACPFFLPTVPLSDAAPETAPLGDLHGGSCGAALDAIIDANTLRRCCNTGYGRNDCARAATSEADASRFFLRSDHDGVIEVAWAQERDHHPFGVGIARYSPTMSESPEPLNRQIAAFVACYLRQNANQRHL
jgi:hypothetical protein